MQTQVSGYIHEHLLLSKTELETCEDKMKDEIPPHGGDHASGYAHMAPARLQLLLP